MVQNRAIFSRVAELVKSGGEFAVITILNATAGTPRKSGVKMLVFRDGKTEFTIGGGNLEKIAVKKAVEAIKKGENIRLNIDLSPGGAGNMICGGAAEILIEVFSGSDKVVIFGGGHVGLALSKILDLLGFSYIIADDRKEFASAKKFP